MTFSLSQILVFIVIYLTGLFAVAHLADRGIIPERITRHPATYVLSLGVFAGALGSNGVIAGAHSFGYSFLLYYIGIGLMLLLSPLLMFPVMRICRIYQLSSLPDLLTFRFRSPWIGALVTVTMVAAMLRNASALPDVSRVNMVEVNNVCDGGAELLAALRAIP